MRYVTNFKLIFYSAINLKPSQIYFRVYYLIRNKIYGRSKFKTKNFIKGRNIYIKNLIPNENTFDSLNTKFFFLNKSLNFKKIQDIDFGVMEHGELWCYNMNYFDYINQEDISIDSVMSILNSYAHKNYNSKHISKDPYPTSLRIVNLIKFISFNKNSLSGSNIDLINNLINDDSNLLQANIEYHLLGNHILENFITLIMTSIYFRDANLFKKYQNSLLKELNEQFLDDGFHFELSIMYHNILVERLLDLYEYTNIAIKNEFLICEPLNKKLKNLLKKLLKVTSEFKYEDNTLPLFNDTLYSYNRTLKILNYSHSLGFDKQSTSGDSLIDYSDSGYLKFDNELYKLFFDAGKIGPRYIPGHGHCDLLSFELSVYKKKVLTNVGVSTYDYGERRRKERSTASHNTIINALDEQSEIWSRFRVGRQSKIIRRESDKNSVVCEYMNYNNKYTNKRKIIFEKNKFCIIDQSSHNFEINIYCMPNISVETYDKEIKVGDTLLINFNKSVQVRILESDFAQGYNSLVKSFCINMKCQSRKNKLTFSLISKS